MKTAVLLCLLASAAMAEPEISLSMVPGKGTLVPVGGSPLTPARDDTDVAEYRFVVPAGKLTHYQYRRAPFDDYAFALGYDSDLQRWRLVAGGKEEIVKNPRLGLSRTVRLNLSPSDAQAQNLQRLDDGGYVIPNAWTPDPIVIVRSAFQDGNLVFRPGELDNPSELMPATTLALSPRYGPFSYTWFNVLLASLAAAGAGGYLFVMRPKQKQRMDNLTRSLAVMNEVTQAHPDVPVDQLPPLLGKQLVTDNGREYTIIRRLGQGGMGAVFEASDKAGEKWAIKVMFANDNTDAVKRFSREFQVCARLNDPGIVKVMDWGVYAASGMTVPFMVMELVDGRPLSAELNQWHGRGLPVGEVVDMTRAILKALASAHQAGIIHRDLKPENVMFTRNRAIKVMDFGLARDVAGTQLTRSGTAMGTPNYMSPEHLNAKGVTFASDLYCVGAMMYELLSGHLPFEGDDIWTIIGKLRHEEPTPVTEYRPSLPPAVGAFVARLMAKEPKDRPPSAAAALVELNQIAASLR